MKLLQIEFALSPSGDLLIQDAKGVRTYREEDRDITDTLFAMIETDYPEAFAALQDFYAKSRHNLLYYKYKVVHRFLRCNFGRFDNTLDIDARGMLIYKAANWVKIYLLTKRSKNGYIARRPVNNNFCTSSY